MKKVLFALLTVLILVGLVSCNPQVDRKLWDYKVTFDINIEGKDTEIEPQIVHQESVAEEPKELYVDDTYFAGWYTTKDCLDGTKYDFDTPITEDITLYAKWWNPYLTFVSSKPFTISVPMIFGNYDDVSGTINPGVGIMQYSTTPNKESSWTNITELNNEDIESSSKKSDGYYYLYFRGKNNNIVTDYHAWELKAEAGISVYGNIMTLLDYEDPVSATMCSNNFVECFSRLFADEKEVGFSKYLTRVSEDFLPAKNLADNCYRFMFYGCSNLQNLPKLPSVLLADYCYSFMFAGCNKIKTIPENYLPATVLKVGCYQGMFNICLGIKEVPVNLLHSEILADCCYQEMFSGCENLKNIPNLPAEKLQYQCYQSMFEGCTQLKTIPENYLPADKLAENCYRYMFEGCMNLETIPEKLLHATELADYCYAGMFQECISLKTIPEKLLPAENLSEGCYSEMFMGCTSLEAVPENLLPATKLADYCYGYWHNDTSEYYGMFSDCTSLKQLPKLPTPTDTATECYESMFAGCTSLKVTTEEPASGTYGIIFTSLDNILNEEYDSIFSFMGGDEIIVEPGKTYYWYL